MSDLQCPYGNTWCHTFRAPPIFSVCKGCRNDCQKLLAAKDAEIERLRALFSELQTCMNQLECSSKSHGAYMFFGDRIAFALREVDTAEGGEK